MCESFYERMCIPIYEMNNLGVNNGGLVQPYLTQINQAQEIGKINIVLSTDGAAATTVSIDQIVKAEMVNNEFKFPIIKSPEVIAKEELERYKSMND